MSGLGQRSPPMPGETLKRPCWRTQTDEVDAENVGWGDMLLVAAQRTQVWRSEGTMAGVGSTAAGSSDSVAYGNISSSLASPRSL